MPQHSKNLTEGRLLATNVLFSLAGHLFPALAAIFSIPILINALGADGFGVMALAWMVSGYFGLLDLGVGRALTKLLSEKLGRDDLEDIPDLIWTALMLTAVVGLVGALGLSLASSTLVDDVLTIPPAMRDEVELSFLILAMSVTIVICNSAMRGILESYQRFDLINFVRVPIGSLMFLGPILVLPFSEKLPYIVGALVLTRLLELGLNTFFCIRVVPELLKNIRLKHSYVRMFLSFGGWMTISSIIAPLMTYVDRFLIGTLISLSAIAYYVTSHELITRMRVIPGAIVGVVFPSLASLIGINSSKVKDIYFSGIKYTFILVFPIVMIVFIFAREGLSLWLGDEFSLRGTTVLQLLSVGALISSFSYFPFAAMHAAGRPDLTAKLHLIEAPVYIIMAWILIVRFGIEGAALAWVLRTIVDSFILFYLAGLELKINYPVSRILQIAFIVGAFLLLSMLLPQEIYFKMGFASIGLFLLFTYSWKKLITADDRRILLSYTKRLKLS